MEQSKIVRTDLPILRIELRYLEIQMLIQLLQESNIIPEYPEELKKFHKKLLLDLKCFIIAEQQLVDELNKWQH